MGAVEGWWLGSYGSSSVASGVLRNVLNTLFMNVQHKMIMARDAVEML